jgi:hypothetical protein
MADLEINLDDVTDPSRKAAYEKAKQMPRRGVDYTSAEGEERTVKYARPVGATTVAGIDLGVDGKPGYWLDAPKDGIGTRFIDITERSEE